MSDGGKGSKPRPFAISPEDFAKNWELIFGKKNEKVSDKTIQTNQTDQSTQSGDLVVSGLQQNSHR